LTGLKSEEFIVLGIKTGASGLNLRAILDKLGITWKLGRVRYITVSHHTRYFVGLLLQFFLRIK
jgi:hypothetical protein